MRSKRPLRLTAVALVLLSSGGCQEQPGVHAGSFFPVDTPVLIAERSLVRGEAEGILLGHVGGLHEQDRGELLVSDSRAATVIVLDAETGEVLGSFGQADEGPGQLRAPAGLGSDGIGRVWVLEASQGVSVFEPTDEPGEYRPLTRFSLREWVLEEAGASGGVLSHPIPMDDGIGLLWVRSPGSYDMRQALESSSGLVRVSDDGTARVEFDGPTVSEEDLDAIDIVLSRDPNRRFGRSPVAGASGTLRALSPDGRLAQANPKTYTVEVYGADGSPQSPIEGPPLPVVALTDREREDHAEPFVRMIENPDAGLEVIGELNPETKNPLHLLGFDRDGDLWVQLSVPEESPVNLAHVFGVQGELARVVVWPKEVNLLEPRFRALGADRAWGVALDTLDVASLVQLRFRTAERADIDDLESQLRPLD